MGFYRSCAVLVAACVIVTVSYECDKNCKECKNSTCLECKPGYFPNRTGMCQTCTKSKNCKTCLNETTCETCVTGSFLHPNGHCEPCAGNCFRCVDETSCTICETGYRVENGKCTTCPDNCNKCVENNKCSQCNKGFYVKDDTCVRCSPRCLSCSSYDNCTECMSGSWGPICNESCLYVNNNISKCKNVTCHRETGECFECEEGAFGVNCENRCPNNCQKGICDKHGHCFKGCKQGFYGDTCDDTCPKNCQGNVCLMDGNCTRGCSAGYYGMTCDKTCLESQNTCFEFFKINGTCIQQCPHNCIACISETNCTVCKHGFYGNMCEYNCTDCKGNQCKLRECSYGCKEGLYSEEKACKACRRNCSRCTSFDQCDKCLDGWYGPTCQLKCNGTSCFACEINSNHCTKCKPGYTLRNNNCCPENCLNCNGDGRCLTCADGFYGDTCNRSCMENCKTCSSRDNCTECGLHFYDSRSDLEAGLCLCDKRECKFDVNVESCHECKQSGWYTNKEGCCPCPKYCKNQSDCKLYTGNCKNGCKIGWFGSRCDKRCTIEHCVVCRNYDTCQHCEYGYYGQVCQYNCSPGCVQGSEGPLCDIETGHCLHGCTNGTWGKTCNRTCSNKCVNRYCNSSTGHCLECDSTHYGLNCEKAAESEVISINPVVPIIVACIVICIVVVAVVMVIWKRSQRGNQDSDINKGSVEMDVICTTPSGARGRRKSNPDDEVITENALYEPFQPSQIETNAQNALLAKSGSSGEGVTVMADNYDHFAPNNPDAVYALPIKDGSRV